MRSEVRCPECGFVGEIRGTEEFFEVRGIHPESRMPVRKCRNCGAGFELRAPLFFLFGSPRARLIEPDFWELMEAEWERHVGSRSSHGGLTEADWRYVQSDPGSRPLGKLAEAEEEVRQRRARQADEEEQ